MIFPGSLLALQAREKLRTDHPLLIQIQDMFMILMLTRRKLVLRGFLDVLMFGEMRLLIELLHTLLRRHLQMTSYPFYTLNF